jgi:hypothetical protein
MSFCKPMNTRKDGRKKRPTPPRPDLRFLIVAEDGQRLSKSGLDTAWQRLMKLATDPEHGIISKEARFGLHAMKHRGITDTDGTKKDKQLAGGHKTEAMTHLYDHDVSLVSTPKNGDFSGEFSGGGTSKGSEGA